MTKDIQESVRDTRWQFRRKTKSKERRRKTKVKEERKEGREGRR